MSSKGGGLIDRGDAGVPKLANALATRHLFGSKSDGRTIRDS